MPGIASASPFAAEPYSYAEAHALASELGLSEPVAVTLVRRGYRTAEQARAFLAADETHSPWDFEPMRGVVETVRAAIEGGRRITVHGDFDVDGVCATALTVSTLRELGAECDWFIPSRIEDGYGLSAENVRRLAERGTGLLITVDCGIASVGEVALARELGMEVVVTDHHQPAEELPDCPILHPRVSGYPFEALCGTAVAWKLCCALREGGESPSGNISLGLDVECPEEDSPPPLAADDLDLVALATVADVVPLVGENRALVKQGLAEIRRAQRPGIRALLEASKCDPERLDEGDLSFRLAPRINAAGRLYRADAGVELFLTEDSERAAAIADELSRANSERRATEREVDAAAEAARRELPEGLREARGFAVAGQGWHPGVVGIVASRLVERHLRPAVVISLDESGNGRGSGRSIPGFDLLAALQACAEHLEGFGGHRAAAGLQIKAENVEAFQRAFAAHADEVLSEDDLRRTEKVDAIVGGVGLGLDLAEELRQLAPFGMGNPGVRLLVPSARVSDVRTMGEGKHARFSLHSGAHRALGVAFGRASLGVEDEDLLDASVRLEVNHWNGSVEPRVVLRELHPLEEPESDGPDAAAPLLPHACSSDEPEWWSRFEAELGTDLDAETAKRPPEGAFLRSRESGVDVGRRRVAGDAPVTVVLAELVSSGAGVLAVCADASRRGALANGATGLARFNGGAALIACHRCGDEEIARLAARADSGLALTDYAALERQPELAASFEHVVLVDPPRGEADEMRAALPCGPGGFLHVSWTEAELEFAGQALAEQWATREGVAATYRALRQTGDAKGGRLRAALSGAGGHPLCPEASARRFRVLRELGLLQGSPDGGGGIVRVVSSVRTDLQRSAAFRAYSDRLSEAQRSLARPKPR
ncbi:MAG TPA: single-stranded-DNA-specific exonuclease RecJ [Solirubrobacterales bacterium]|nr:single-stranded-DNA-specific exonuclease RecJ [Solirubrobacterales bacterium]